MDRLPDLVRRDASSNYRCPSVSPSDAFSLLEAIRLGRRIRCGRGVISGLRMGAFDLPAAPAARLKGEQSHSSFAFADALLLKIYSTLHPGTHPEIETGRFLAEKARFRWVPALAGALEYRPDGGERMSLGVLHRFIPNRGSLWELASAEIKAFRGRLPAPAPGPIPKGVREALGPWFEAASLLGKRTAELHRALASGKGAFAARPLLRTDFRPLPAPGLEGREDEIAAFFRFPLREKPAGLRIRCHGDLHLGQVLSSSEGLFFVDFEGEPHGPPAGRRARSSPLKDVAGMLRSFDYAGFEGPEHWAAWSAAAFLRPYLARAGGWGLLPRNPEDLRRTLDAFRMEKALYELSYERSRRPSWARIPMRGILDMLDNPGRRACFSQG